MDPDVRKRLISIITKTKTIDATKIPGLVDAMYEGCGKLGIAIVDEDMAYDEPDAHLTLLKEIRRTIRDAIAGDVAARDLASLTRRLQDISKEVASIEEKMTADKRRGKSSGSTNRTKGKGAFDPSKA